MNWRWYFTGLLIALAFYGASVEPSFNPNQEIVIQFTAKSISSEEANQAITDITSQLEGVGVEDVRVSEVIGGKIKISYYSTVEVGTIKNLFYKQNKLHLTDTAFNESDNPFKIPFDEKSNPYRLEVVKIHNNLGSDLGFHGLLIEVKSVADQYLKPKFPIAFSEINFNPEDNFEHKDIPIHNPIGFPEDTSSHKIPEVRAGPFC